MSRYAFFSSHKVGFSLNMLNGEYTVSLIHSLVLQKQHSRFGDASADLARASKDYIFLKYGLEGYFDAVRWPSPLRVI